MSPDEWNDQFLKISAELARLAEGKANPDAELSERERALLDILDELEMLAAAKTKQGVW